MAIPCNMAAEDPTALTKTYQNFGYKVHYTSFGAGPPLIFLHGTPWSSRLWAPIARCFASAFTVYLYDMPGYGASAHDPLPDHHDRVYPRQTQIFSALLRHWHDASGRPTFRPHVVAHDIGGAVALRALLLADSAFPAPSFASLALVDCGAAFPVDEPFFSLVRENASVFQSLPAKLHEAMLREYLRGASFKGLRRDQEDMLVAPLLSPDGQRAFYRQIESQRNEDVAELAASYRTLDCPLHIIWAEKDTWVPVERAHMLHQRIGGSLKIIENAGHLVQLDAPEELTFELSQWLQRVTDAERAARDETMDEELHALENSDGDVSHDL